MIKHSTLIVILSFSLNCIGQTNIQATTSEQTIYWNPYEENSFSIPHNKWHIAFETEQMSATIRINDAVVSEVTQLDTYKEVAEIEIGMKVEGRETNNDQSKWEIGAFNFLADPSNQFDYGWGAYSLATHTVKGHVSFIVEMENQEAYGINIVELIGSVYEIHTKNLATNETSIQYFNKSDYPEPDLVYYNFISQEAFAPSISEPSIIISQFTNEELKLPVIWIAEETSAAVFQDNSFKLSEFDFNSLEYSQDRNCIQSNFISNNKLIPDTYIAIRAKGQDFILKCLKFEQGILELALVQEALGNDTSRLETTIFPNPSRNFIYTSVEKPVHSIVNLIGAPISNWTQNGNQINISKLEKGKYFIVFESGKVYPFLKH